MSSRDVNGQPGWTKVSVTIDYLLVLLHITPSSVWFMQGKWKRKVYLCQMAGCRWPGKFLHTKTNQNQSNAFAPLRLRFAQQKSLPKSAALPLVGPARRCRVNSHSEVAPCSCTWSRLCWRPKYHPPRGSFCGEDAPHACSLSTSQPNLPSVRMSPAVIITSMGVSLRIIVPSTARATHRDHYWSVQWSLEGLLAFRAGRGSACGLPLPHLHRFYANVVDLLLVHGQ